jgi:GTPase SAR1 family protein
MDDSSSSVVVFGKMRVGKSTLCNMLYYILQNEQAEHYEGARIFDSGLNGSYRLPVTDTVQRETVRAWNIVDTPGLSMGGQRAGKFAWSESAKEKVCAIVSRF